MWAKKDLAWLKLNYPAVKPVDAKLEGQLSFRMIHDRGQHVIDPQAEHFAALEDPALFISDTYHVSLELDPETPWPAVRELGGRIEAVAARLGVPIIDLHVTHDGTLCLASGQDLIASFGEAFSLERFFHEYLIPYLYAQSYFAQHQIWLWGELSHGAWGALEWLGRAESYTRKDIERTIGLVVSQLGKEKAQLIFSKRYRGHQPCYCGSGKISRRCHPDLREGITRSRKLLTQFVPDLK